jgi:UTP--glucose-1-phosphate uridylyltransferase
MHVLTAAVFDILHDLIARGPRVSLSDALSELARREQCLAMLTSSRRYDLGVRYGFLTAQLALALHGRDSRDVLSMVLEVLAQRQMQSEGAASGE